MTRKLLLALMAALGLGAAATVPVKRTLHHQQPDGTTIEVCMEANGRFATYSTTDGLALMKGKDGHFYYACRTDGALKKSTMMAHAANLRTTNELLFTQQQAVGVEQVAEWLGTQLPPVSYRKMSRSAASTEDGLGKYLQPGNGVVSSIGSPVIPVVLADFQDVAFQPENDDVKMSRMFNEEGYADEDGSKGSVRDYFMAQSNGLFSPTFEVVAHVTLPNDRKYYGEDESEGKIDPNRNVIVRDALDEASKTVDFSAYATDGKVPLVAVIFAGPGQQSSFEDGHSDYLWACFNPISFTVNDGNTTVSSYFIGNELLQKYGSTPNDVMGAALDGVGLFSHEFGHALGLTDYYYTGKSTELKNSLLTMGYWDIMDYGQYYFNGYAPVGYTAYERSTLGWLDMMELTEPAYVELFPKGREDEGPQACFIRNPENEKEYYILENRQKTTWTPSRMGAGMLVLHVDYDANQWVLNTVNNDPDHQRMAFVPADGVKEGVKTSAELTLTQLFEGYKGDLFPGTQGVTELTDTSSPAMTVFTPAGVMGKPIYHIQMSESGVVSFCFLDETLTGIDRTEAPKGQADGAVYTLEGRRVASLQSAPHGVYILKNGQKVIK